MVREDPPKKIKRKNQAKELNGRFKLKNETKVFWFFLKKKKIRRRNCSHKTFKNIQDYILI